MRIDNTGNVGIGTTNPGAPLDVERSAANDNDILRLGYNGSGPYYFGFARSNSTGALLIQGNQAGNNNIVLAPTSGNVGIGTTEPDGKLHVHTATAGSVTATADGSDFVVEGSDNAGMSILTPDASQGQLVFGTPSDSFGAQVTWNHDTDLMQVGTRNAGADLELTTGNGSTVMHLNDSGNVGIGEVAPGSKLSVSGGGSFGAGYDTTAAPTNGLII